MGRGLKGLWWGQCWGRKWVPHVCVHARAHTEVENMASTTHRYSCFCIVVKKTCRGKNILYPRCTYLNQLYSVWMSTRFSFSAVSIVEVIILVIQWIDELNWSPPTNERCWPDSLSHALLPSENELWKPVLLAGNDLRPRDLSPLSNTSYLTGF